MDKLVRESDLRKYIARMKSVEIKNKYGATLFHLEYPDVEWNTQSNPDGSVTINIYTNSLNARAETLEPARNADSNLLMEVLTSGC